jgi:hypothetical protein
MLPERRAPDRPDLADWLSADDGDDQSARQPARISRYLLMQCIINGSFGVAVDSAFLIGVPTPSPGDRWRPPFGSSRT